VTINVSQWGGDNLVIGTVAPHKLRLQSLVTIAGMTFNNTVNGTYRVQSIGSDTQFTVYTSSSEGPGNYSAAETGTVTESTAVETTNEAFPTPEQAGNFWLFKNNDGRARTVNFLNGPVTYENDDTTTTLELAIGQKMTVLYTGSNFIVL
jgi:hypothetical protein